MNYRPNNHAEKRSIQTAAEKWRTSACTALRAGAAVAVCVCMLIGAVRATGEEAESPAAALPMPAFDGAVESIDCVQSGGSLHLLLGVKIATSKPAISPQASPTSAPAASPPHRHGGKMSGDSDDQARIDLLYTRLDPPFREWTKPVRVNAPEQIAKLSRGNDAKLAVGASSMLAVWTLPGNGAYGSGPLTSSRSEDGGKSWVPGATYGPKTEASEAADAQHGFRFPAVAARGNDFYLIWIDALNDARRLGFTHTSDNGKTWAAPAIIDPVMCACCPNALAATTTRIYGLYRNHEPSDMGLAVSSDAGEKFSLTPSIEKFGWIFEGCPHVGGSIAVLKQGEPRADPGDDALVCSTWSGDADHGGVHITRSMDSGATWSKPVRVSESDTSRTSDLAALDERRVAVAWDELDGTRKVIFASTSVDGGVTWAKPTRWSDASSGESGARVIIRALLRWTGDSW